MRTFLRLKNRQHTPLPSHFDELRYTEELVSTFLRRYTRAGDLVLDPFGGYGTTLLAAEAMGRVAYAIEFDAHRAEYMRSRVTNPEHVIHGDSRHLLDYKLPLFDFSITSPPFTERSDTVDPFTNYTQPITGYAAYLDTICEVYIQLRQCMRPEARIVLEIANLKGPAGVTTLAWDVAHRLSSVLTFEGEVVIGWDHYDYGYDHSYCLVFRNAGDVQADA